MKNIINRNKLSQGFTLVEMLVVVLIIGILAAIAVPQYQVAVEKSRFSTLKDKTRAIAQAINVYYLANGQYPTKFSDLDISFGDITQVEESSGWITIYFSNEDFCQIWPATVWDKIACGFKNDRMRYYYNYKTQKQANCYAIGTNKAGGKVCEQETTDFGYNNDGYYYGNY